MRFEHVAMTPVLAFLARRHRSHRPEAVGPCDLPDEVLAAVLESAGTRVAACPPAAELWWIRRA